MPYLKTWCVNVIWQLVLQLEREEPALQVQGVWEADIRELQLAASKDQILNALKASVLKLRDSIVQLMGDRSKNHYLEKIRQFVAEHYSDDLSFTDLMNHLHLSRSHLSSVFKRETGETFMSYLTRVRVEKAKELLRTNRYLMNDIASQVGYQEAAYFSRVFKQKTGMSPTEYVLHLNLPKGE